MEIKGNCKRMSTMFNRIEKTISSQIEEIQRNVVRALDFIKAEFDDNKYCDFSSYSYNGTCVIVRLYEHEGIISYNVKIEIDTNFSAYCQSRYNAILLREILDSKHDTSEAEQTSEQEESAEHTEVNTTVKKEANIKETDIKETDVRHLKSKYTAVIYRNGNLTDENNFVTMDELKAYITRGAKQNLTVDVYEITEKGELGERIEILEVVNSKIVETESTEAEQTVEEQVSEQTSEQEESAEQSEHNKKYIVRAFENGKELNVPCSRFNKREYAIDYINNLYENGVVSRDVVFTINNRDIYDCFSDVKTT